MSSTSRQPDSASRGGRGAPRCVCAPLAAERYPKGTRDRPGPRDAESSGLWSPQGQDRQKPKPEGGARARERGHPGGPCPGSGGLRTPLARLFQPRHGHTGHVLAGSRRCSSLRPVAACSQEFRTNVAFAAFAIIL